jgi:hypothetical protein
LFTLTGSGNGPPLKRKAPPFGGAFLIHSPIRLAILIRHLPLAIGVRLLTARILLLLTRLLAATLLLLAGLLTRVLVLLTRIVLIGHWWISVVCCLTIAGVNGEAWHSLPGNAGSAAIIARQRRGSTVKREPLRKN